MRRSLLISLTLHGLIIVIVVFGMPQLGRDLQSPEVIVVDFVEAQPSESEPEDTQEKSSLDTIAAAASLPERQATSVAPPPPETDVEIAEEVKETELPQVLPEATLDDEEKPQETAEIPEPDTTSNQVPMPLPKNASELQTPPIVPVPARAARPSPSESVEEPEAEVEPAVVSEEPGEPSPRPEQPALEPPDETPDNDDFDALLRSVERLERRLEAEDEREGVGTAERVVSAQNTGEVTENHSLSASELAYIKRRIESCWRVPAAVGGLRDMEVELRILLNQDSTVRSVEIQDRARVLANPGYRAVAESAQRAVLTCELELPSEKYAQWRDIIMVFDPGNAISG